MKLIEFTMIAPRTHSKHGEVAREATVGAAVKAFGVDERRARGALNNNKRIRCTAEQFALFIVYRYELMEADKGVNQIRHLRPAIVPDDNSVTLNWVRRDDC